MKRLSEVRALFLALAISCATFLVLAEVSRALTRNGNQASAKNRSLANLDIAEVRQGQSLFLANCANCHGYNGRGADYGPTLHDLHAGDPLLRLVISRGIKKEMPAFGTKMSDRQTASLIVYLRTLKSKP